MFRNQTAFKALLLLLVAGCSPSQAAEPARERAAVPVRVADVVRARRTPPIRAVGVLASKAEVKLSFKVGGIIERISVDEGALVRRGDVLARLALPEIDAAVAQARRAWDKAERDHARVVALHAENAVTLEALQNAGTALDVARAQRQAAEFNRKHAVIRAPADGRILRRVGEENELVAPGAPVLVLAAADSGWVVRVGLVDRDVVRVRLGDPAQLALDAWPGVVFTGTVSEIASAATAPAGTFEVEVALAPSDRTLLSGLITHVVIAPQATEELALVPVAALVDGQGLRAAVWALGEGGRVERRQVDVAWLDGDEAAVRNGLGGAARVVTDGAAYLDAGSRVTVVSR